MIVKAGDDLRQEQFAMQHSQKCAPTFLWAHTFLWPYIVNVLGHWLLIIWTKAAHLVYSPHEGLFFLFVMGPLLYRQLISCILRMWNDAGLPLRVRTYDILKSMRFLFCPFGSRWAAVTCHVRAYVWRAPVRVMCARTKFSIVCSLWLCIVNTYVWAFGPKYDILRPLASWKWFTYLCSK